MTDNDSAADKRNAVDYLDFGAKTSKRVSWESWEFTVESPHLIRVTNASYGFEKEDHSYLVGIEDRDGVLVPAECECPADKYNEDYDCKHKVALASIGGPVVLEASVNVEAKPSKSSGVQLLADGGGITTESQPESCHNGTENCAGPSGDNLPCFACYQESGGI